MNQLTAIGDSHLRVNSPDCKEIKSIIEYLDNFLVLNLTKEQNSLD